METKTFSSAARRVAREPITFELDGESYTFDPPKTTGLVVAGFQDTGNQVKAQLNWLGAGLPEDQAKRIQDRLLDLEDDLDIGTVVEIVTYLLGEMAGRPTGPSSG